MNEFNFTSLTLIQIGWLVIGIIWVTKRSDEVPLLIATFLIYIFGFRFWALLQGWALPVNISNFGFESLDINNVTDTFAIAVVGESGLLGMYLLAQRARITQSLGVLPDKTLLWLRSRIFFLFVTCFPVALYARWVTFREAENGKVLAFESSAYLYLFPFVLTSIVLLLALLWKARALDLHHKVAAILVSACIAGVTFQPSMRFQFLSWLLACTFIFASGRSLLRRGVTVFGGVSIALIVFAIAGALRQSDDPEPDLQKSAFERFAFAEDANMLDGFVLLRQVYPALLPFDFGAAHLEIFQRPIPRAWWPDKPVGGYMNRLGLTTVNTGATLGISPSIFGTFYQEGDLPAVILLSCIYGLSLGWVVRFSARVSPTGGVLIRAILCAFLIPLLRGGDLPGIVAWGFMAFWPCLLILWLRRHDLLVVRAQPPLASSGALVHAVPVYR